LVACHDTDAQNARLARHIWDDNGLDVVEVYAPALLKFLGKSIGPSIRAFDLTEQLVEHDNAYVRTSAAVAFTEAVERWPSSVIETIDALLRLYHEKVAHWIFCYIRS
jgi:hypothetical protein